MCRGLDGPLYKNGNKHGERMLTYCTW